MNIRFLGESRFLINLRAFSFTAIILLASGLYGFGQEMTTTGTPRANAAAKTAVPAAKAAVASPSEQSRIKVVFDEKMPGVVFIESNGERIRVDTTSKTVAPAEAVSTDDKPVAAAGENVAAKTPTKADDQDESPYDFDKGDEPFDYRVVNIPTGKSVPKGTWNMVFTHRFTQPLHPLSSSAPALFGLDSYGIASFGMSYGITDKLYVSAYRSPLCQKGLCRTIELGVGYNWLAQDKDSPIGLTTFASVEGNDNFTEEYTYNLQAMLSGRIGKRVYLFFSPAVHLNSNGQRRFDPRPRDYFPPATVANAYHLPTNGASFGFGASVLITPRIIALFDFTPRIGFKLGEVRPIYNSNFIVTGFTNESHPSIGFGLQKNIGRHSFAITFSNTQTTTTSRYNSSNLVLSPKNLVIGFNLSRRF
jgi:hypothetical protein